MIWLKRRLKKKKLMRSDFPIDLVVTYVNDRDPIWRSALEKYNVEP